MKIWQVDFYHHPQAPNSSGKQWELVICNSASSQDGSMPKPLASRSCQTKDATGDWLAQQFVAIAQGALPDKIQVFRPQTLGLVTSAGNKLNIPVEATRNTDTLKQFLQFAYQNSPSYNPVKLKQPPPLALPENLWGDEWQIANIAAGQIVDMFRELPIPICRIPQEITPLHLNLASDIFIPGIAIYGGRQSMQLARWIEQQDPYQIKYQPTEVASSGGFILETGLVDRWIFNTFESSSAAEIAHQYEQKKQLSQGLHFLLIQPDDSGMTTTAFWLLKDFV